MMLKTALLIATVAVAAADPLYTWSQCKTPATEFKVNRVTLEDKLFEGDRVHVTADGTPHMANPLFAGSWQVRVYETGMAHSIYTTFGDLTKVVSIHKNAGNVTAFTAAMSFVVPKAVDRSHEFTASFTGMDQTKNEVMCFEVYYNLTNVYAAESKALVAEARAASADFDKSQTYNWTSCGDESDRLGVKSVGVEGTIKGNQTVKIVVRGVTHLHEPLVSGAWMLRIYEQGVAHAVAAVSGDLTKDLTFNAAKTEFNMVVPVTLTKSSGTNEYTATLTATDQTRSEYLCVTLKYDYIN